MSDLEGKLASLTGGWVRSVRVTVRTDECLHARVTGPARVADDFSIVLRPGWCWMQGRALCAAMAVTAEGDGARLAWGSGLRVPGTRRFARLMRVPLIRTIDRVERTMVETPRPPAP